MVSGGAGILRGVALMDQLRRRLAEQQAMQAQVAQVRGGVPAQPMPQQQALPTQAQAVAQRQQQLGYGQPVAMHQPVASQLAAVQDRAQLGYQQASRSPLAGAVAQQQAQMFQRQALRRRRLPF